MQNEEPTSEPERAPIYWMREAIVYLGLDRLGLTRPDSSLESS